MSLADCPDVMTADGAMPTLKQVLADGKDSFARFDINSDNNMPPLSAEIAVVFDSMTADEVKEDIEKNTHIMVAGILRSFAKMTNVTFEDVEQAMTKNVLASSDSDYTVMTSDRFVREGDKSSFLVGGKPTAAIMRDIKSWLSTTIADKTVIADLDLNMTVLGRVITAASQSIDWLSAITGHHDYTEKTLIDVGVLRFPDDVREYFQLYHVELKAFLDVSRELDDFVDRNGMYVTFTSKRFIPRESIIAHMKEETQIQAEQESIALYTSKPKSKSIEQARNDTKWPTVKTGSGDVPSLIAVLKESTSALNSFDMTKTGAAPLKCDFAVAFDDIAAKGIRELGRYTLALVSGVNRSLVKMNNADYESLKSMMSSQSLFESKAPVIRSSHIEKTYVDEKFPSGTHADVAIEVKQWMKKLVNDAEILEDIQGLLDLQTLVLCLVKAGKHISTLGKIQGSHEYNSRELVDLTVLRYPDPIREYFHLYKLEISAFTDCTREMVDEVDKCGLMGSFQAIKFGPRESVMSRLSNSTLERIGLEALTFYGAGR